MSSAATSTATLMPNWGKSALLVGLCFCACWGGSIIYWRTTDRMPTAAELAFLLVGVPLLLCGGVWLSRKLVDSNAPVPDQSAGAVAGLSVAGNVQPIAMLASALRLPHGSTPDEVCAAIKSNKARPDLDPNLRDADGFPVMTCRCAGAGDLVWQDEIAEWFTANGFDGAALAEEHLRALVLASQVVIELASALPDSKSQPLNLVPIAPHHWTADLTRAAGAWLQAVVVNRCAWAAQACAVAPVATNDQAPMRIAGALRAATPQALTMVLAFDSNISDAIIQRWDDDRTLFNAANQSGRIPGEGAAGVVVATSPGVALDGAKPAILVSFEEGILRRLDEDSKRIDPSILVDLMKKALSAAAADGEKIAMVAADTGHRANRTLELLGAKNVLMPALDDAEDVLRLGAATGYCGAVQSLAALIVARSQAIERQRPTMWISNEDLRNRSVAIVAGMERQR